MPYTKKSLAIVWLTMIALVALTGSGTVAGRWFILVVLLALAVPAVVLKSPAATDMTETAPEHGGIVSDDRERSPHDPGNVAASDWENEGGAGLMHVRGGIPAATSTATVA